MPPPASNAPWLLQKPLGKLTFSTGHLGILSETGLLYSLLCYLSLKNLSSLALLPELSAICILSTCHLFFLANNLTIENGKTKCSWIHSSNSPVNFPMKYLNMFGKWGRRRRGRGFNSASLLKKQLPTVTWQNTDVGKILGSKNYQ